MEISIQFFFPLEFLYMEVLLKLTFSCALFGLIWNTENEKTKEL